MITNYFDADGNALSIEDLRKLLRRNSHPQFNWWKAKQNKKVIEGKLPPGVRQNANIRSLGNKR